ncbi:DUF481 domain-containing protein [Aquimarina pacifica]|uniref:DUF481 domain-containing protein n=1 Tax=Aquimarina pacifica TaxID=1296415 RepID=UPI0005595C31|nr:DUF481 domain-containing protein [Aquimarina pacifica]
MQAQIVNVENLRHEIDSTGWSGHVRLDGQLEKNNTSRILNFSNQLRLQYKREKSVWFLIHDMSFKEINATEIINNSTQHLRYSHELSSRVSYEAFLQSQSDKVSEIKIRALAGTGLRFNLYNAKKYKFFLGVTMMYEYENSVDDIENVQNNIRSSNYVSFKIKPNDNISLVSSNYFQPLIDYISDYRILSETAIMLKIVKNLKFITTLYYIFDSFPVTNVAKEQYKLTSGLVYSFD